MSDEKVIVSKGLLDNIANPLMQATETTDNLSLPEIATAARMMLPAKWELVIDTTIEQEVSDVYFTIPNVEEVVIFAQNEDGLSSKNVTGTYPHYMYLWGEIFMVGVLKTNFRTTIAHGIKIDEYAMADWALTSPDSYIHRVATRSGCFIPQKIKDDTFGIHVKVGGLLAIGTKLKIWAKRRVSANE